MKILATFIAGALCCGVLAAADARADDSVPATLPGVWQKHEYNFRFLGFTTTYSCDGLADKVKLLLLAAGARSDLKSIGGACASGYGRPDKFAAASVTFYSLAPTPTSTTSPDAAATTGVWQSVSFKARSPRELTLGDCELVEQFRNVLLPMFSTRNVEDHMTCVPQQLSGSLIDLSFESFQAAKKPAQHQPR